MDAAQSQILQPVPKHSRYLSYQLLPRVAARDALAALQRHAKTAGCVLGLGESLVRAVGASVDGLRESPALAGPGVSVPSTPMALWVWLAGDDRGELLHRGRELTNQLREWFELSGVIDGFRYREGLDLSGYEDGTENPQGEKAVQTAFVPSGKLAGSSFVAVQQWQHELDRFAAMSAEEQDHTIGRRRSDNDEIDDAPASAHVKRTAQESFEPEAFILRRSMPWAESDRAGLVFVAFGKSFDAFEALLERMLGLEDGTTDALFHFTRPLSSSYFWCPPVREGRLDLSALGM
ncbi:MAG: Dyp-type peroxidase [Polyangiaceae bacterium]